jgi:hypothetical protein
MSSAPVYTNANFTASKVRFQSDHLKDRFWPTARIQHHARKLPHTESKRDQHAAVLLGSDFGLFRNLQRVIDLNAEIANGTLQPMYFST